MSENRRRELERHLEAEPDDQVVAKELYNIERRLGVDHMAQNSRPGWMRWPGRGVKLIHRPTGLSAVSVHERSQRMNKLKAKGHLSALVMAERLALPRARDVGLRRDWTALYCPDDIPMGSGTLEEPDDLCRRM